MNLRQLQYFVRVFEMQNMTRAAKSLYAAQPALSQQIALLEEDLGIRLLVRGSKGCMRQPKAFCFTGTPKSYLGMSIAHAAF